MENKQMTTEQALQVLEQVTAQIALKREEHGLVITALQTLAAAVSPERGESN